MTESIRRLPVDEGSKRPEKPLRASHAMKRADIPKGGGT
jgi:hypothetical protein